MCKLTKLDEKMLKMLGTMDTQLVADQLGVKKEVIYQHLFHIRKRRVHAQIYVNKLNNFERMNARVRRMLTPTKEEKVEKHGT